MSAHTRSRNARTTLVSSVVGFLVIAHTVTGQVIPIPLTGQPVVAEEVVAPPGFDFWRTVRAVQPIYIPADFVGPDTDAFAADVVFVGRPLAVPLGDTDTVIYRKEPLGLGRTIGTRVVAFANITAEPIKITGKVLAPDCTTYS
jgi:hypothetical protein